MPSTSATSRPARARRFCPPRARQQRSSLAPLKPHMVCELRELCNCETLKKIYDHVIKLKPVSQGQAPLRFPPTQISTLARCGRNSARASQLEERSEWSSGPSCRLLPRLPTARRPAQAGVHSGGDRPPRGRCHLLQVPACSLSARPGPRLQHCFCVGPAHWSASASTPGNKPICFLPQFVFSSSGFVFKAELDFCFLL